MIYYLLDLSPLFFSPIESDFNGDSEKKAGLHLKVKKCLLSEMTLKSESFIHIF